MENSRKNEKINRKKGKKK